MWRWVLVVLLGTLGACTGSQKVAVLATPVVLPSIVPAQSAVRVGLSPLGTTEAAPVMVLDVKITDAVTGQPVLGDVWIVAGESWHEPRAEDLVAGRVSSVQVALSGKYVGWVLVEAEGYQRFRLRLNWQVKTSRVLEMPVRLERVGGGA